MLLEKYGWSADHARKWEAEPHDALIPARVVADFGSSLKIATPEVVRAELSGKLAHHSSQLVLPKIGDWVATRLHDNGNATIEYVFERRNEIARRASGNKTVKQIMAANVDVAFIILSLDNDFSVERLRRFIYQLSASKVRSVIVLNKADKTSDIDSYIEQVKTFNLPIIIMTATKGDGGDELRSYIKPGDTAMLLGSSGVGKSTVTNLLLGEEFQATQEVRESDDTGKHTTVHRELFMLPNGGMLIDTPGIRELQLWGSQDVLEDDFQDVIRLEKNCRYTSCRHGTESGCAIREALLKGELSKSRYNAYLKMKNEIVVLQAKQVAKHKMDKKRPSRDAELDWRNEID